jgi:hypothetical protein
MRATLIVQHQLSLSGRKNLYLESRRTRWNFLFLALLVSCYPISVRQAFAEYSHIVWRNLKAGWGHAKVLRRQRNRGRHHKKFLRLQKAAAVAPAPAVVEYDIKIIEAPALVETVGRHRGPEGSGGWKILTGQFPEGRHHDLVDFSTETR